MLYLKKVSVLAHTSRPYSEALTMRPVVLYIPYNTSSHEQTGNILKRRVYWKTNGIQQKTNQFLNQVLSHLQRKNLMMNKKVKMLLKAFGTENMCIGILEQEIPD